MNKIQVMRLVYESNLDKYEKLFLLEFIVNEPEESIPFIIQEFNLGSISKALKKTYKKGKEAGKKISKKASDAYFSASVKAMHHPVISRALQYPAAVADLRPGAFRDYPAVASDVGKGMGWAKKKLSRAT